MRVASLVTRIISRVTGVIRRVMGVVAMVITGVTVVSVGAHHGVCVCVYIYTSVLPSISIDNGVQCQRCAVSIGGLFNNFKWNFK